MRRGEAAIASVLLVAAALPARADSSGAEVLFQEGRALLQDGDLAGACERFEASDRLEASVGTLLNLGDCREQLGETEIAHATFLAAEVLARRLGDEGRAEEAARRAGALQPPTMSARPPPVTETAPSLVVAHRAPDRWTGARKLAVVVGAVGVVSLGGGVAFGLRTAELADRSDELCPGDECADPEGLRLNRDARDLALRANICFGVAAASLAGAAALWLLGRPAEVTPVVSREHVAITLGGRF